MSSIRELTFFLELQVKHKKDGIFISQDKYVTEILKKYGFTEVKNASTPMETQKPLLKDEDGEEVDVHMYRSMIGSLVYLTSSRPDIMFAVCAYVRYQVNPKVSHLHVVKRIFRYLKGQPKFGLWYPKDSPFDLVAYTDSDYAGASLDRKYTTGGCQFLGYRLISWQCKKQTVVANSTIEAEYVVASSCCRQFWTTTKAKSINGEAQIHAKVDGKKVIIFEASIRRDLQFADKEGVVCLPSDTIFKQLTLMRKPKRKVTEVPQPSDPIEHVAYEAVYKELDDRLVRASTAASSLKAKQDSGNINKTQSKATPNESSSQGTDSGGGPRCQDTMGDTIAQTRSERVSKLSNDSLFARGNTLRSDEDSLKLNELMELCTTLQLRVLDLEKIKTTQALEIDNLKRRVKKLGKKQRSRTHKLKRLYKVGLSARVESSDDNKDLGEDTSKQGRKIHDIDADEDITLVNDQDDEQMFYVNDLQGEEVFVQEDVADKEVIAAGEVNVASIATTDSAAATMTIDKVTLAQALMEIKSTKPKAKWIVLQEPKPVKPKKKDQVRLDEEVALKLQAEFDEEEQRLARESAQKEEKVNIALIEEWNDIQAKIDKRRKFFAAKATEEKRNKPPTEAQQRKIMCTYLKNMEGKKLKDLKNKSFDSIQKMFDKAFKRVNTFKPIRSELVEGSSKRAGEEIEQESSKKPKIDDDK
nr:uncharacterized mitochondrial protein AtMg00810-like [Tanacetum cinerariifolium]